MKRSVREGKKEGPLKSWRWTDAFLLQYVCMDLEGPRLVEARGGAERQHENREMLEMCQTASACVNLD